MFVTMRTYRVRSGSIDALMHRVDRDLAEAFVQEPGFIAYQVAQTGPRTVASITTFHERVQAEASNELAAEWVARPRQAAPPGVHGQAQADRRPDACDRLGARSGRLIPR